MSPNGSVLDVLWTQKDGTQIAVSDMTEGHVQNALNMLKRHRDNLLERKLESSGLVFLQDPEDLEHLEKLNLALGKADFWIRTFQAELDRRNLTTWDRKRMQGLAPVKLPPTFSASWKQQGNS